MCAYFPEMHCFSFYEFKRILQFDVLFLLQNDNTFLVRSLKILNFYLQEKTFSQNVKAAFGKDSGAVVVMALMM